MTFCPACASPLLRNRQVCARYVAWHDLAVCLEGVALGAGLHARRLRQAQAALRQPRESLEQRLAKLARRVAALELEIEALA